jgi:diguanylate cyclase (GGDEF)-like protein/PAS domain S-box-containing protein
LSIWPFRSDGREVAALSRLIEADGVFARMAAPVLLVTGPRAVKTVNTAGRPLANALVAAQLPELEAKIAEAQSGATPSPVTLSHGDGEAKRVFETSVLPLDGGAAALVLVRDATMDRNLQTALIESRQRFRDLVEISSDFAWEVGADGRFTFVSPQGALGYSADQLVGQHPDRLGIAGLNFGELPFLTRTRIEHAESWLRHADGSDVCLMISAAPIADADGGWRGARGVCHDVTAQRERDGELAAAQNRRVLLSRIIRAIRDEVDPEAVLGAAANAIVRALGASACVLYRGTAGALEPAILKGTMPQPAVLSPIVAALTPEHGVAEIDLGATGGDGRALVAPTSYRSRLNGALVLWRTARDRSFTAEESELAGDVADQLAVAFEQLSTHQELTRLSSTDTLTGLKNRRMFFSEVSKRLAAAAIGGHGGALVYVDLDNFKTVNDIKGHQAGDEALKAVARLLADATRSEDVVGRLGGDEFALWLDKVDEAAAARLAERLLSTVRLLVDYSGDPAKPLGFSIGMATFDPKSGESMDALVARGDEAMYVSKKGGKGRYHIAPPMKAI